MSDGRFAGVDWASREHAVCVVDEHGRIEEGRRFRHDEPGIRALCARLVRLGVALVALERPDGLLIERLLDAGLSVVAVHPNQVKAMRPRYSVAGGKSDVFDSFVLAELARTDSHRFRVLVPDSDRTKALRAMTRARDSLVRTRIGLANQLRDQLDCFWPGAAKVSARSTPGSRWRSCAAIHHRPTLAAWASSALRRFSSATDTPDASPPASCSSGCAAARKAERTSSKCKRAGRSCWRLSQR
jgi:transposase